MLGPAAFVGFVPVRDLGAARSFYSDILGLKVLEENEFSVVVDACGTAIRLTLVPDLKPQPFTIAGWEVDDIALCIDALIASGVTMQRYDQMDQDERGVWTTPNGDRVAWFTDQDGNVLSLTSLAD